MRKHFNGSVFLPLLLIAVFGFNAVHSANYCSSKGKLTTMFIAGNKIYFGFGKSSGSLFTFDIDSKKHGSISGGKTFGTESSPVLGVHFDPIGACFTNTSNAEYCSHSEVFDGMVIFIDGKRKLSIQQVTKKGAFKSYNRQKSFVNEKAILPTTNSRLYAAIYLLFEQVANSKNPKFTAATYNSFVDGLFLAATIDDSVANLPEWGVGKYVIFWTNFAPNGLIQDAYVYAQMDAPVTGLIDYNGELFALMESGTIQMIPPLEDQKSSEKMTNRKASGGKARGTTFKAEAFFGCDGSKQSGGSPLMVKQKDPPARIPPLFNLPNVGALFFPKQPDELKVINSSLLSGRTFILIVAVLSILLVVIVTADVFIVYQMNSKGDDDEGNDYEQASSPWAYRKSSPSSAASSSSSSSSRRSSPTKSSKSSKGSKRSKSSKSAARV